MPFTSQEISDAGKIGLDFFLRNNPIDQIGTERPLLKKLMGMSKEFPGGKQYVTEQLRKSYGSNFQWYYGSQAVTYNSRQNIEQAQFAWRGAHDGFFLDEDRLLQNGISMEADGKGGNFTAAEEIALTDLLQEETEALRLGFEEKFDYELHLDGTQNTESLPGLDLLVSTTPTTGTVGGLNAANYTWWRNSATGSLNSSTIIAAMETSWRSCTRNGGRPDFILAGEDFIDTYRAALLAAGSYEQNTSGIKVYDGGVGMQTSGVDTGLAFKGVPITWDPVLQDLDDDLSPTIDYVDRCYFLNCRHMKMRPARGHNMVSRRPPREYNRYVMYWALTWKGAFTTNRRNAHSVLSVA